MKQSDIEVDAPQDKCIFLLGCDRSGTTLLQNLLNAHPDIMMTYELGVVYPFENAYREQGVEAAVQLARERGLLKGSETFNEESICECGGDESFAHLMAELLRRQARRQGKRIWGDKRPGYTAQVPRLAQLFPNAFFINIVRDPRAVAFSWAKTDWGPMTAYSAAKAWKARVQQARLALEQLEPRRSITVRFEDVIDSPGDVLALICTAIGVKFDSRMLEPSHREKSRMLNERLERLHPLRSQPVQKQVAEKWREHSRFVISHIETVCHEEMTRYDYAPATKFSSKVPLLWKAIYRVLDRGRRSWRRRIRPLLMEGRS